jgi:hypothetical protein
MFLHNSQPCELAVDFIDQNEELTPFRIAYRADTKMFISQAKPNPQSAELADLLTKYSDKLKYAYNHSLPQNKKYIEKLSVMEK